MEKHYETMAPQEIPIRLYVMLFFLATVDSTLDASVARHCIIIQCCMSKPKRSTYVFGKHRKCVLAKEEDIYAA